MFDIPVIGQLVSDRVHGQTKPADPIICLVEGTNAGHHSLSDDFIAVVYSKAAHDSLFSPSPDGRRGKGIGFNVVGVLMFKACG